MLIEKVHSELILKKIDEIKNINTYVISNIFLNFNELHEILEKKECLFLQTNEAIFIMIPYHNTYYDILYTSININALNYIISKFKSSYNKKWIIRVSVVGKEPQAGNIASLFLENGFTLGKKLARTQIKKVDSSVYEAIQSISLRSERPEFGKNLENFTLENVSFAIPGEEKKILSILLEEFDPCDDNIPELDIISENINKNRIITLRDGDTIACLHYFEIKNGKYYGLYDITRKEYRDKFLFFMITEFMKQYFEKNNIIINRSYAWRDTANKRIMKFARLNNQIPDGVYIYNMKWDKHKNYN